MRIACSTLNHRDDAINSPATCPSETGTRYVSTNGFRCPMVSSQTVVEYLPGFTGKLPFRLETGYIGTGEREQVEIFYYFVESERSPENDPFLLWLTGGPGCSGFYSLAYEIGPFNFDYANSGGSIPKLVINPYSWTKVANIMFVDQPIGTGFSYAKTAEAYKCSDTISAIQLYELLKKWLINHPKYLENPLYIGGVSYAGIFVPLLVDEIYKGIEAGNKPHLNFKGYILGNPGTDYFIDGNAKFCLLTEWGSYQMNSTCVSKIYEKHILEPWCDLSNEEGLISLYHMRSYEETAGRFLQSVAKSWCRDMNYLYSKKWANTKAVQKALQVREGTIAEWKPCNSTIGNAYVSDVRSTVDYHKSGDHDMIITHTGTEEWIRSLKLDTRSSWRPWFVEGQIAGYTTAYSYGGDYELTYATVKGAGHTASEFKPLECFPMIDRWLSHVPL